MKKILVILMALLLVGGTAAEAKKKKTSHRSKKKTETILPLTKGEAKEYGDYLTTRFFNLKKGEMNSITLEYPIEGNPKLVNAMRTEIKNYLDPDFQGSLDNPEALMRHVMKNVSDISYGQEGESLNTTIEILYSTPEVVTLGNTGDSYMGGAHGMAWDSGTTFLVGDGTVFTTEMLPPFEVMRPYILEGLAENFGTTVRGLSDVLLVNDSELDYPATVIILADGLNFIYAPYEIAPWSAGIPRAVVPVDNNIFSRLSSEGKKFFKD